MHIPGEDADSLVESAMAAVGLDGADIRCPWQIARMMGIRVEALIDGPTHGQFDLEHAVARVRLSRCAAVTRWRLAHELGHLVLCLHGLAMPHDEGLASRCARSLCMGRRHVLRALRRSAPQDFVQDHAGWLPAEQVGLRVWEVSQSLRQLVG